MKRACLLWDLANSDSVIAMELCQYVGRHNVHTNEANNFLLPQRANINKPNSYVAILQ
jgi:hypothetical protein